MKREILFLSALCLPSFSHADSWESVSKSTYQSSAYSESKQIVNQDGTKTTVYYIDAAMQSSACQGAKDSAKSVFEQVKVTYQGVWPDSEFRLVTADACTYNGSPGQQDKSWSLSAYSYLPPFITHGQLSVNRGFKYYMRLTRIYFRKSNQLILMLSFLVLGLGIGFWLQSGKNANEISAIKSARSEQARAVTPDSASDLPRLSINSFSQLGFDVSVTFVDAKGMKYQYFDLIKDGYSVDIKDACRIVIRKGRYLQTVTCQE